MKDMNKTRNLTYRIILMILGVALIGMGSGIFRVIDWGLDPFSCAVMGGSLVTSIKFGNVQLGLNILMLIVVIFLCRKSIGLGTLVNMVGVGYMSDFTVWIVNDKLGYYPNIPVKIIFLIVFLMVFSIGIAMYMEASMGTAPYDTLGDIIEDRTHGKIPYRYARVIMDIICVAAGSVMALFKHTMVFGVCTIILACLTGIVAGYFRKIFRKILGNRVVVEQEH